MKHALLTVVLALSAPLALAQERPGGAKPAAPAAAAAPKRGEAPTGLPSASPAGYRKITWDDLMPPNWDPFKAIQGLDLSKLSDADPRATALLDHLREAWDNAPVNERLSGQAVRLPGFVVPLEESAAGLSEFLLVPYFGACIHTPPPPSNQIVHVVMQAPVRGYQSMDAVWIQGKLSVQRSDTYMGKSGYRMEGVSVERYQVKPR
jgi:hypothetical protein